MTPLEWLKKGLAAEGQPAWHRLDDAEWGLGKNGIGWLIALLIIGFVARLVLAVVFPSSHHPDEIFQYWEQGYRLVYDAGIIPWEYHEGIRSWVVPGFIAGVIWVVEALGGSNALWRFLVQCILSAASLSIVVTAFFWARRLSGLGAAIFAALVASVWFEFLYFSAKPLTEVIAAAAIFPAAYLLCAVPNPSVKVRVWGGALLGATLVLRFHLAPMVLVIGLAHLLHTPWRKWWPQVISGLLVVLAGGILDWVTLGAPFQSIWLNFSINIFEGIAAGFGTSPIFWYFILFANSWVGIAVPILILYLIGFRRSPLLFVAPLAIILALSLIGHKEYRFVYPTIPFVLTLVVVVGADIFALVTRTLTESKRRLTFITASCALVLISINLAAHDGFWVNFVRKADQISAFEKIGKVEGLCGVALGNMHWAATAGVSRIGKPIPVYWLNSTQEAEAISSAFNAIEYDKNKWPKPEAPYEFLGCYDNVCIAARPGGCTPHPEVELNTVLATK
jgi:hypothetical protein